MNPPVHTQFAPPDPNVTPLNLIQLVEVLNRLVSSEITGDYITYLRQSDPPGPDDHDKVWIQVDTAGRPLAVKTFYGGTGSGAWRRVYNGMLGEVRGYTGDPSTDFDENGLGKIGEEYDGWHLCNGKDGVPDLSDRFLIAAHMNNVDAQGFQDGEWLTTQIKSSGDHEGGFREITLNEKNTFQPPGEIGAIHVGRYKITPSGGETLDASGPLYGKISDTDDTKNIDVVVKSTGTPTPEAINIINPFIALGYIIFVGYN